MGFCIWFRLRFAWFGVDVVWGLGLGCFDFFGGYPGLRTGPKRFCPLARTCWEFVFGSDCVLMVVLRVSIAFCWFVSSVRIEKPAVPFGLAGLFFLRRLELVIRRLL